MPPAVEAWSLNHWTARGVPLAQFLLSDHLRNMIWKETTRLPSQPFCTMTSWYIFWKTCSTSFINKIDKDSFPSITSSMTFTTSLNEKVQIRALFKIIYIYIYIYFCICLHQVLAVACGILCYGMQASLQLQHTGLAAPQHVESEFPNQGSNLHPMH